MFKEIIKKCGANFSPALTEMELPRQEELFSKSFTNNSHIKMGLFYEMLTSCLFGGYLSDSLLRSQTGKGRREGPMPDVWDKKKDRMGESKACRLGHSLNLLDGQMSLYRRFQVVQPNTKIYFSIWRHRLKGIKKYRKSNGSLFKELSEQTAAGIILPFSIVHHLHGMQEALMSHIFKKFGYSLKRYETDKWDHCTRVSSTILNMFLLQPRKMLTRLRLDTDDYIWHRYIVPKINICGNVMSDNIPFVLVRDISHTKNTEAMLDNAPF